MRTLLLLPFLLGFSVPVFASESCGNLPNGWDKESSETVKSGSEYYALMSKDDGDPMSGSNWGVWNCDNNEAAVDPYSASKWNVKDVDCITAIDKYNEKTGANLPYPFPPDEPPNPKACPF